MRDLGCDPQGWQEGDVRLPLICGACMPRPAGVLDLNDCFVARSQDMTGAVGRRRRTNRCVALLLPSAS